MRELVGSPLATRKQRNGAVTPPRTADAKPLAARGHAATGKKVPGAEPICSYRQLRLIHPVWLFRPVPKGFWAEKENRLDYLLWLGGRLGYRQAQDWYQVTAHDFRNNRGRGVLTHYHSLPTMALTDLLPEYEWLEWGFAQVPWGFWRKPRNRRRYGEWLGRQLGLKRPEDWARVRTVDIAANHGGAVLSLHSKRLQPTLRVFAPRSLAGPAARPGRPTPPYRADFGMGRRPFPTTWQMAAHKVRSHSGSREDLAGRQPCLDSRHARAAGPFVAGALAPPAPGHAAPKALPELSEGQIVSWAKAWHEQTGRWPTTSSGALQQLPGDTWSSINAALIEGYRGLRGGSTLAKLLRKCGLK